MTDKVYHSFGRTYRSRAAATAIQYAGGSEGWVVPSTERLMEDPEGDLATGSLNAFGESHSTSSFDVTIDMGEALVGGAYLARDTTTTVTLSSSTTGQTVYIGWQDSVSDAILIGKSNEFGSNDRKIPVWTFDTDGSGVTTATDKRNLDNYRIAQENVEQGQGSGFDADTVRDKTPSELVPSGIISMWSGTVSDIPSGWVLCDGNNGTPDLTDRFVVGAGNSYATGDTGGADTVQLTESELASHAHRVYGYDDTGSSYNVTIEADNNFVGWESGLIDNAGGDSAHENRPPYHALAYIMKV